MYVLVGMLLIGALLFALWRMSGPANPSGGTRPTGSARPTTPPIRKLTRREPLAPDDNPEFLRELDRRARRDDEPPG
ncbi:MAG: hypothetical protein H0T54_09560 [Geodermatophilaceae bacterium]|nr:hypothetical protein [Geodermatophilaceae bacterium]